MGTCFKLFGKAKLKDNRISECIGSTFFVAENYLLTCKHLVSALSLGDELFFRHARTEKEYRAVLDEVAEGWDLALLRTENPAPEEAIFPLDRVVLAGREAVAYGFPHGGVLHAPYGLKIGAELGSGVGDLTNAGAVTVGYSGGPICPASDPGTAIGVLYMIKEEDEHGHLTDVAGFVHARIALELWGERYGLREKRYEVKSDAFGSNSFVYSALKTDFQDPNNYIGQLRSFIEDNRPVLWWAVVGPGGIGKSRLCYELAHSLNSSWRCKLLGAEQLLKDHLQKLYDDAGRNFLLLADYAYTDTNELGAWLDERARALNGPHIRVLLLQRETGWDYFGWQETLLHGSRNLKNLRYQKDLELEPPRRKEMVALMRSYAKNEGGEQIDAEELYTVLEDVDSGLTRPLFAMFIVDAEMHGGNPRGWNPEEALAYFIQREKSIIEKALKEPEDTFVAELLRALATITNGFTFNLGKLDSSPFRELRVFSELPQKERFLLRLENARLADWGQGGYIIKPLKPDLLGEYYVLDMFRKMMNDPRQKESPSILLRTAKEIDMVAAVGFLMRLFKDYKIDEEIRHLCFGQNNGLFRFEVVYGGSFHPNTELLRKLYKVYGTDLWLRLYAASLAQSYNNNRYINDPNNNPKKTKETLNELRTLHREHPQNYAVACSLVQCLYSDILTPERQSEGYTEFDEIRAIYEKQPRNTEVAKLLASVITHEIEFSFRRDSVSADRSTLLKELHDLYMKEPKNIEVAEEISKQLGRVFVCLYNYQEVIFFLDELRTLFSVYHGNELIAEELAFGLSTAMERCFAEIDGKALMEELHKLHRDYPGNASITREFASGLSTAIRIDAKNEMPC